MALSQGHLQQDIAKSLSG